MNQKQIIEKIMQQLIKYYDNDNDNYDCGDLSNEEFEIYQNFKEVFQIKVKKFGWEYI